MVVSGWRRGGQQARDRLPTCIRARTRTGFIVRVLLFLMPRLIPTRLLTCALNTCALSPTPSPLRTHPRHDTTKLDERSPRNRMQTLHIAYSVVIVTAAAAVLPPGEEAILFIKTAGLGPPMATVAVQKLQQRAGSSTHVVYRFPLPHSPSQQSYPRLYPPAWIAKCNT